MNTENKESTAIPVTADDYTVLHNDYFLNQEKPEGSIGTVVLSGEELEEIKTEHARLSQQTQNESVIRPSFWAISLNPGLQVLNQEYVQGDEAIIGRDVIRFKKQNGCEITVPISELF